MQSVDSGTLFYWLDGVKSFISVGLVFTFCDSFIISVRTCFLCLFIVFRSINNYNLYVFNSW